MTYYHNIPIYVYIIYLHTIIRHGPRGVPGPHRGGHSDEQGGHLPQRASVSRRARGTRAYNTGGSLHRSPFHLFSYDNNYILLLGGGSKGWMRRVNAARWSRSTPGHKL